MVSTALLVVSFMIAVPVKASCFRTLSSHFSTASITCLMLVTFGGCSARRVPAIWLASVAGSYLALIRRQASTPFWGHPFTMFRGSSVVCTKRNSWNSALASSSTSVLSVTNSDDTGASFWSSAHLMAR